MRTGDEDFMALALQAAAEPGATHPNPRVGAVVVRDGEVLAVAWHRGPGTPHAEVEALRDIDAAGATLYVTLEPCVHTGLTPPCLPVVLAAELERVVIAIEDPDRRVRGRGTAGLRAAGIQTDVGAHADEARRINAAYIHHRTTGRAYVTLKLALSLDGRMAAPDGSAHWITGEEARRKVHARRAEAGAVLVGAGTVLADDPQLTVRMPSVEVQPARIAVDSSGRIPATARIFERDGTPVTIVTTHGAPHEVATAWKEAGGEILVLPESDGGVDLGALITELGRRGVVEVYCEGGAELATSLLAGDLVERLELYYGGVVIGRGGPEIGDLGVSSLERAARYHTQSVERLGDDVVVVLEREPR